MSVDTVGIIEGKVSPDLILGYIQKTYDPNATMSIVSKHSRKLSGKEDYLICNDVTGFDTYFGTFIDFYDGCYRRSLWWSCSNTSDKEVVDYWEEKTNDTTIMRGEHTILSLRMCGNAINVIKDIISQFGGYIDECDCDDILGIPVEKIRKY